MGASARIEELRRRYDENQRRFFAPLANEYRKAGDLEQAIALCRLHLPTVPNNVSGQIVFGQALFDAGEFEESRVAFEAAIALDPENLIALRHLGDVARLQNDVPRARMWYQRVLEADRRDEDVRAILGELEALSPAVSSVTPVAMDATLEVEATHVETGPQDAPAAALAGFEATTLDDTSAHAPPRFDSRVTPVAESVVDLIDLPVAGEDVEAALGFDEPPEFIAEPHSDDVDDSTPTLVFEPPSGGEPRVEPADFAVADDAETAAEPAAEPFDEALAEPLAGPLDGAFERTPDIVADADLLELDSLVESSSTTSLEIAPPSIDGLEPTVVEGSGAESLAAPASADAPAEQPAEVLMDEPADELETATAGEPGGDTRGEPPVPDLGDLDFGPEPDALLEPMVNAAETIADDPFALLDVPEAELQPRPRTSPVGAPIIPEHVDLEAADLGLVEAMPSASLQNPLPEPVTGFAVDFGDTVAIPTVAEGGGEPPEPEISGFGDVEIPDDRTFGDAAAHEETPPFGVSAAEDIAEADAGFAAGFGLSDAFDDSLDPLLELRPEPSPEIGLDLDADFDTVASEVSGARTEEPDALPSAATPAAADALQALPSLDALRDMPTPIVPHTPVEAFATETMAELYVRQGLRHEAIAVYRQLLSGRPGDQALAARLRELESAPAVEDAPSTARSFFSSLARRRAARQSLTSAAAVAEPARRTVEDSLGSLLGTRSVSAHDERAAENIASAFDPGRVSEGAPDPGSLDRLFERPDAPRHDP